MIIIPELDMVVVCPPRTGSTTLKAAIAAKYPESFMLYRHMEADAIPQGYDTWRKIGVVRHPVERLRSLYNYCKYTAVHGNEEHIPEWYNEIRIPPDVTFSEWVLKNRAIFTMGHGACGTFAAYHVRHAMPETMKSQFHTLRPDLGTKVYKFEYRAFLERLLDVDFEHLNRSSGKDNEALEMTAEAKAHIEKYFAWDLEQFK